MRTLANCAVSLLCLFLAAACGVSPAETSNPPTYVQPFSTPGALSPAGLPSHFPPAPTFTLTPIPSATLAPAPLTLTLTPIPSATPAPATPTLPPFLPSGLAQIDAANIQGLQQLASLPVKEIYQLVFSPSGDRLAALSEPWDDRFNDYLTVWDLDRGAQLWSLQKMSSPASLFFSADGTQLYVFFAGQGLDVYHLASGELIAHLPLDADHADLSPDGSTLALATIQDLSESSLVRLVDLQSGQERLSFTEPGMVMYVRFSPNGQLLITGAQLSNHFRVSLWALPGRTLVNDLVDYDTGLVFSSSGNLSAAAKAGQVILFSGESLTYFSSYAFSDPYSNPRPSDFSLAGDVLAVEDRYTINFLQPETGLELLELPSECAVRFSPGGKLLVTWCYQAQLKIWGVIP
jgi:WD40 repeat protein